MMLSKSAAARSLLVARYQAAQHQGSLAALLLLPSNDDPTNLTSQVRWKRRDGHKNFYRTRGATKKQKRRYKRRQAEIYHEQEGKHSAPNSIASKRRVWEEEIRQEYLKYGPNGERPELEGETGEYELGDALLDDLMGNTAHLTSTPTPQPQDLSYVYDRSVRLIKMKLKAHQLAMEQHAAATTDTSTTSTALMDLSNLPTDHEISLVIRSFRDQHKKASKKNNKPVGIVKTLELVLKELGIPLVAFGEESYTSLLTCCATPSEARRIFRLAKEQQHPLSPYSWSILVDVHAKIGDFQGCDAVLQEMVKEGVEPTLPAYTSLMAACYKTCSNTRLPMKVREEAWNLCWSKWKEMRITGIEADAMAYCAMIRVCSIRGQAEKAASLLDEMPIFKVKPTTLCYTAALRAVGRSHEIANRYQNGTSPAHRRRQVVASHHGNMARQIVIQAENAEVQIDDGFISALMLCAAAAGDSATAKAILLAGEVRQMDHLRTIGPESHLKKIRGGKDAHDVRRELMMEDPLSQVLLSDENESDDVTEKNVSEKLLPSLGGGGDLGTASDVAQYLEQQQREYFKEDSSRGKEDTRLLTALLHACSVAANKNEVGSVWEGRDNKGYLCEDTLNRLTVRPEPEYMDNKIPGVSEETLGLGSLKFDQDEPDQVHRMSKRERRKKNIKIDVDDTGTNMDDIDDYFYKMFKDEDPIANRENPDSYEEELPEDDPAWDLRDRRLLAANGERTLAEYLPQGKMYQDIQNGMLLAPGATQQEEQKEEWYFDSSERKWKTRGGPTSATAQTGDEDWGTMMKPLQNGGLSGRFNTYGSTNDTTGEEEKTQSDSTYTARESVVRTDEDDADAESVEEMYFDQEERQWKVRGDDNNTETVDHKNDGDSLLDSANKTVSQQEMDDFNADLNAQIAKLEKQLEVGDRLQEQHDQNSGDDDFEQFGEGMAEGEEDMSMEAMMKALGIDDLEKELETIKSLGASESDLDELRQQAKPSGRGDNPNQLSDDSEWEDMISGDFTDKLMGGSDMEESQFDEMDEHMMSDSDVHKHQEMGAADFDPQPEDLKEFIRSLGIKDVDKEIEMMKEMGLDTDSIMNKGMQGDSQLDDTDGQLMDDSQMPNLGLEKQESTLPSTSGGGSTPFPMGGVPGGMPGASGKSSLQPASDNTITDTTENDVPDYIIEDLQAALPGMPLERLQRVRNEFKRALNYPSLLSLVPHLRENMPERVTMAWLRQKNLQNATFVMQKAAQDGVVDKHMLNGQLQVETSAGNINRVLSCHATKFQQHGLQPNGYSDRLVFEMLVKERKVNRALKFKHEVELSGRNLDVLAYGTLIDYYGKRNEIGSAMMTLKECIRINNGPPNEWALNFLRRKVRHQRLTQEVGLEEIVGPDPLEWLRYGKAVARTDKSRKGSQYIHHVKNAMTQI